MRRKYGNTPTVVDGVRFDSKAEAARWKELRLLERAGNIRDLTRQKTYKLVVNGRLVASMRPDFEYVEDGVVVTEDVKSPITAKLSTFRIKSLLFEAIYGRKIKVTIL